MMRVDIPKGKYILAVSGGVDSMVLLHLLVQHQSPVTSHQSPVGKTGDEQLDTGDSTSLQLVVAHFNHGIRSDSGEDEKLVAKTAEKYELPLEIGRAKLGPGASEDKARQARYEFLEKVRVKHNSKAIITAHHQDDMIETALLNTLRGTKRRGLTALADNPKIMRPLLKYSKTEIIDYAKTHRLKWREDSTNEDQRYLRNVIRKRLTKVPESEKKQFAAQLEKTVTTNARIDEQIAMISQLLLENNHLNRQSFINLPAEISREVTQYWLRNSGINQTDRKLTDRATTFIKTGKAGTKMPITKSVELRNTAKLTELWIA